MSKWFNPGLRSHAPDNSDYVQALIECGRDEEQIEAALARAETYLPTVEAILDGKSVAFHTNGMAAAAVGRALSGFFDAPAPKARRKAAHKCCPHCGGAL